jgi:hypothetical protein
MKCGGGDLTVRVIGAERIFPPVIGRGARSRVRKNTINRTNWWQALSTSRTELGHDDYV